MKRIGALAVIGCLIIISCGKNKNFPSTPFLGFKSIDPPEVTRGVDDSLINIVCEFRDAEGDIAGQVYFLQSNNPFGYDSLFALPDLPAQKNMQGNIILQLHSVDLYYPEGSGTDSVTFRLYIKDRAGHVSDTIETSKITLIRQ